MYASGNKRVYIQGYNNVGQAFDHTRSLTYRNGYTANRGQNGQYRVTSGAKMARTKDGHKALSAWKKTRFGFLSFYASLEGKFCKKIEGSNGQQYITGVSVVITNKDTLQKSYAWGIYSVTGQTLTMDNGRTISLKKGGFVGKSKIRK